MGSDLIAWVVALMLGVAVVVLGWRRNLGEVTQDWLPRFGESPEPVSAVPESADGGQGRQLSPRQRRLVIWGYLGLSLGNAAIAVLGAHDRPLHAVSAAAFGIAAVVLILKERRLP
jgi:uncharacterized membrane protein HdeD (DUF308 family)